MSDQITKELGQVSYCCAYWEFLRGTRERQPSAAQWGLDEHDAHLLRLQCQIEMADQSKRKDTPCRA